MLRFADPGGRVYGATATIIPYWTSSPLIANWAVSAANGRYTGSSLRATPITNSYLTKTLDAQATWGIAFAFRFTVAQAGAAMEICGFFDSTTQQVNLTLRPEGTLWVTRNGTFLGTSTVALVPNIYYHIEFKTTIHPTAGTAQLWVNGASQLNLTSQNTRSTANSNANIPFIGSVANRSTVVNWDYDDIIIYDGQTTDTQGNPDITGPIGDCGAYWLLPSGAGSSTQFTPDSGSNYARVADTIIDTTSYVESSTVNNLDLYALTDAGASVSAVKSLQVIDYGRKTDTGSRGAKAVLRTGGTNYAHTNEMVLSDTFLYYSSGWGTNPNTGVAWTVSDINGLETGPKVSS